VPPQKLVDRGVVDVSALGDNSWPLCSERHFTAQHIPQLRDETVAGLSEAGLDASSLHEWAALIAIEKAREKPSSLMAVTPTMRSWNQFSAFIEEWDGLRIAVR
jgi:hypothetical protein